MNDNLSTDTARRLNEIEMELAELRKKRDDLKGRWKIEKMHIHAIRDLKSQIEEQKQIAAEEERNGNYSKVAEIRYGVLIALQKQLDEAHAQLTELQKGAPLLKEEIDAEDIAEVVAKWTGIPVQRMLESEREELLKMESRLQQRIVGQDEAVAAVANSVRRARAGLQDSRHPIASFIFLGSTGIGKTEMAKALAEFLFDDEESMIRLDMSEYMEKHSVSRLVGAPPGYVGYEEGGQLTEAVRRKPFSVVLLDEIEKAHPDVFNILLQVLDEGRLTDSQGTSVDFRNTIIIMTSNMGSEIMQTQLSGLTEQNRNERMITAREQILELLRKKLRPEFLNRIDEVLLFKPLLQSDVLKITKLQMNIVSERIAASGIILNFSDDSVEWVSKRGYDVQFGARPLKRVIQRYIADPLAIKILSGEVNSGDTSNAHCDSNGQMHFNVTTPASESPTAL
ncbi:MAG: AAA family ATPase [Ignavibacteria bacterium]|nr:AAA family ATPase [Ignavibacteria bacterium]